MINTDRSIRSGGFFAPRSFCLVAAAPVPPRSQENFFPLSSPVGWSAIQAPAVSFLLMSNALRELDSRMSSQATLVLRLSLSDANRAVPHASGVKGTELWKDTLRAALFVRHWRLVALWRKEGRLPWPQDDDACLVRNLSAEQSAGRNWVQDDRLTELPEEALRFGLTFFTRKAEVIAIRAALIAKFPLSAEEWRRFAKSKTYPFPLKLARQNPSFPEEINAFFSLAGTAA